jgi:hypothetical protein
MSAFFSVSPLSRSGILARFAAFLRRNPILFLILICPGIPEYLSGSSAFYNIVADPLWFVLGLIFNLGMYVPGVLLIREAQVRWNKGWATVLALGAAYAIVEEGIGLCTMFYPGTNPIGPAGTYGHYLGVNWVWVPEVMLIHMIFTIGVPLLLFSFVFPELRGKRLLSNQGIVRLVDILCLDIFVLVIFVSQLYDYWMGTGVLVGSLLAVAAICLVAYVLPKDLIHAVSPLPDRSPVAFAIAGVLFYFCSLLLISIMENWKLSPVVVAFSIPIYCGCYLSWVLRHAGKQRNEHQLLAFCFGLILPLIVLGAILQIRIPIVLLADVLAILFFWHMYLKYPGHADNPRNLSPLPSPPASQT